MDTCEVFAQFTKAQYTHPTMHSSKRWIIQPPLSPQANENLSAFPPVMRQILFNRGYATVSEAQAFLRAEPNFDTDPFQMTDMQVAIDRIRQAITLKEKIAIYGDYDVDGVTATALLVQVLTTLGGNVVPYIPNRFEEGYGLNPDALTNLRENGVELVITVDCGIRSPAEVAHARTLGLALIITDHHQPAGELPPALAIINPKRDGDAYPDKDLAGVGVAYKIAQALISNKGSMTNDQNRSTIAGCPPSEFLDGLLDLVALGTVADLAPLKGENRSLVSKGLTQMRQTRRQGLFALANVAGVTLAKVNATNIGFALGPRLNASGRLESALASYHLLMESGVFEAGQLALQLDQQNRNRQLLTREIQEKANELAFAVEKDPLILFAVDREFNAGVVGLAAARLTEAHYRPAVVGHHDDEYTRCSCRSIPEFHITEALDECADLLVRHGGHAAAAGFTVRNENLHELIARLRSIAERELGGVDLRHTLLADMEIPLSELKPELLKQLDCLEPTGYGNREAIFVSRNLRVANSRVVGAAGKHLKLSLTGDRITHDAIAFRLGHLQAKLSAQVDVLYAFERNEFNGREYLQLNIRDIHPAGVAK